MESRLAQLRGQSKPASLSSRKINHDAKSALSSPRTNQQGEQPAMTSPRKTEQELEEEYIALQKERASLLQALKKQADKASPRVQHCPSRSPRQSCKKPSRDTK